MVPSDWDSLPRFVCGPNFMSDLIGVLENFTGVVDEIDHKIMSIFNRPSSIDFNFP